MDFFDVFTEFGVGLKQVSDCVDRVNESFSSCFLFFFVLSKVKVVHGRIPKSSFCTTHAGFRWAETPSHWTNRCVIEIIFHYWRVNLDLVIWCNHASNLHLRVGLRYRPRNFRKFLAIGAKGTHFTLSPKLPMLQHSSRYRHLLGLLFKKRFLFIQFLLHNTF